MSAQVGSPYYVAFSVETTPGWGGGSLGSGLTLSNFTVNVFTVNGVSVDAITRNSLAVVDVGGGYYYATYIPSTIGTYFLGLSIPPSFYVADCVEIGTDVSDVSITYLTQNTGGVNALRPKLPSVGAAVGTILSQYLLMVFPYNDWIIGNTGNSYAIGTTQLDDNGNWIISPIAVSPQQSYTIAIRNNAGLTTVIKPNLEV